VKIQRLPEAQLNSWLVKEGIQVYRQHHIFFPKLPHQPFLSQYASDNQAKQDLCDSGGNNKCPLMFYVQPALPSDSFWFSGFLHPTYCHMHNAVFRQVDNRGAVD
jgi:hypothetical protein